MEADDVYALLKRKIESIQTSGGGITDIMGEEGIEDPPIGNVISFMGKTPPRHYLVCDGSIYNIVDYPALASHIQKEFQTVNYFGGDGETTFAVPDLRGEFLRGAGTNSHTDQGSGTEVGIHQDGTSLAAMYIGAPSHRLGIYHANPSSGGFDLFSNQDFLKRKISSTARRYSNYNYNTYNNEEVPTDFTIRPTNTSVLYCIKYEPTYYMRVGSNANYYQKEETCIGAWIDGKPLYRVVLTGTIPKGAATSSNIPSGSWFGEYPANIDKVIHILGYMTDPTTGISMHPFPHVHTSLLESCGFHTSATASGFYIGVRMGSNFVKAAHDVFIIMEYTKTS